MELIIVQSINDFSLFKNCIKNERDILVLDQAAMITLDSKNIKYKVIEDFYSKEKYYIDVHNFRPKVTNLFNCLDAALTKEINFPYSFSGNEHYFSTWFDDVLFLDTLIKKIKEKYIKFYFFSSSEPEKNHEDNFNFSQLNSQKINGSISFKYLRTKKNQLKIIYNALEPVLIKDKTLAVKSIPLKHKLLKFVYKLNNYFYKYLVSKNFKTINIAKSKNIKAYIIQDSYEIVPLKKYLSNFKYENLAIKLRQEVELMHPKKLNYAEIEHKIKSFVNENFSFLGSYCNKFLKSYFVEIVGRLEFFKNKFEYLVKKDDPKILLVGSGTRDVFDTICGFVFNELKINIISFQHTGTRILNDKAYDESLEFNQRIQKTLIVQSKRDVERLKNSKTETKCFGSILEYERNKIQKNIQKRRNILLCLGPDIDFSFRHLIENYSTYKKHRQSVDIISVAKKLHIPLDIKLHPTGEKESFFCYKKIIQNYNFKETKILYGENVENIANNYKIIITDYISSTSFRHFIGLKAPIIIYDQDFDEMKISTQNLKIIMERCYVAKTKDDLEDLLKEFLNSKLESKWSKGVIDKLIYPIEEGNPGVNIARYIETIV
jgi:hypothetical protein